VTQLGFEVIDGVRIGPLEIVVFCGDEKKTRSLAIRRAARCQASERGTYAEWLKTGIRRVVRVPMAGVPKFVKVVVYDYGSEAAGSFMVTIK
jgi:hypothetical protein